MVQSQSKGYIEILAKIANKKSQKSLLSFRGFFNIFCIIICCETPKKIFRKLPQ